MKKLIRLLAMMIIMVLFVTGCGTIDDTGRNDTNGKTGANPADTGDKDAGDQDTDGKTLGDPVDSNGGSSNNLDEQDVVFEAEVISAEQGLLVTPDPQSGESKSSDKISVRLTEAKITDQEGKELTLEELKAGDFVKITYNGVILESYPAQIGASSVQVIGHNKLIDGYLSLIDDIYNEDKGLNDEIDMIALDTTAWSGLTEIEKEIIFSSMKEAYGLDIIEATYDELKQQGLIDEDQLYFPKGIHIVISDFNYNKEKDTITCAIKKWRSGLGAIGSDEVTAEYKDGKWKISKGNMWIS